MVKRMKHTEIGEIPKDWDFKEIEQEIDLLTGYPFPSNDYTKNGIKLLRGSNVKRGNIDWNEENTEYWNIITNEIRKYQLENGDIVVAMDGSLVGKSFARVNKSDLPALLLQRVARIRSSKIEMDYLKEFICSDYFTKHCDNVKTSSAIPHISPKDIKSFKIPIPPTKHEQKAIAQTLNDTNVLLSSLEKLIVKKKAIKQGVMQQLLKPKEGWISDALGSKSDIFRGGSPRPIESFITEEHNGINWIKIGDVDISAKYIHTTAEKIKPNGISNSRFVNEGDFLLSNSMSFGRPYILKTSGCIHDGWLVIQNYKNTFDQDFLYYILGFETTLNQYKKMAAGSTVLNLNKDIVNQVLISYPKDKKEQQRIAQILSDMDEEILAVEAKLKKQKQFKQSMMQELLTGKIRLL